MILVRHRPHFVFAAPFLNPLRNLSCAVKIFSTSPDDRWRNDMRGQAADLLDVAELES
jgi:hypothetical protein